MGIPTIGPYLTRRDDEMPITLIHVLDYVRVHTLNEDIRIPI